MKRKYDAQSRQNQASQTRERMLTAARELFADKGFEHTTIDDVAARAGISASSVYARFKSKQGLLSGLMQETYYGPEYQALLERMAAGPPPHELLRLAARVPRLIYEAGNAELAFMRGAAMLSPELRASVQEAEDLRYARQENVVKQLFEAGVQIPELSYEQARDLFWSLTGPDLYRMLVLERGWTPDAYQAQLAQLLITSLLSDKPKN